MKLCSLSLEKVNICLLSDLKNVLLDMMSEFLFHSLLDFKIDLMIDLLNLSLISMLLRNSNERSVRLLDTSRLKWIQPYHES